MPPPPMPAAPATRAAGGCDPDPDRAIVATIILTWNQRDKALRVLASLSACGYADANILLWDNGSEDGTLDAVRAAYPKVLVHRSPRNLGVASGRNAAAELAVQTFSASHFLFLDNDMTVTEGFLEALLEPFANASAVAQSQSKILALEDPTRIFSAGGTRIFFHRGAVRPVGAGETDSGQYDQEVRCLPSGGATMVRADVFAELGGFDTVFNPYGPEDLDFSLRVVKAGYHGRYAPNSVVYHEEKRSFEGGKYTPAFTTNRTRQFMILLKRHASAPQKLAFYLWGMPVTFVRVLYREIRLGNGQVILGMLRGLIRSART